MTEGGKQAAKKAALEQKRRRIARRKTTALFTFDAAIKNGMHQKKDLKERGEMGSEANFTLYQTAYQHFFSRIALFECGSDG